MALTVSLQPPTQEAYVRLRTSPCYSWWTVILGQVLRWELRVSPVVSFHQCFILNLDFNITYDCQKDERAKRGNLQTWIVPSRVLENFTQKYVHVSVLKWLIFVF